MHRPEFDVSPDEPLFRPPSDTEALGDLDKLVRIQGDPIDCLPKSCVLPIIDGSVVSGLGFVGWMGLNAASSEASRMPYTTLPLAITAYGVAVATAMASYDAYRMRKFRTAAYEQSEVRRAIDEPVDLFRSGSKKTGYQTILRWYGADKTEHDETEKLTVCAKLDGLLDKARGSGIDKLAIATSWLAGETDRIDVTNYGTVVNGRDFVTHINKAGDMSLHDKAITDNVLVLTPERCRELVNEARKTLVSDIRIFLSAAIEQSEPASGVPEVFEAWARYGCDPRLSATLRRRIQSEVERTLNNQTDSERLPVKDEFGELRYVRSDKRVTVRDGMVHTQSNYRDLDGNARIDGGSKKNLLGELGYDDINQLLDQLDTIAQPDTKALHAKAGLLLLLDEVRESDEKYLVARELDTAAALKISDSRPATMLERFEAQKSWESPKSAAASDFIKNDRLSPEKNKQLRNRAIAGMLLLSGVVLGASEINTQTQRLNRAIPREFKQEYGIGADKNPALYARYLEGQSWYTRTAQAIGTTAGEWEQNAENGILAAADRIGLTNLSPAIHYFGNITITTDTEGNPEPTDMPGTSSPNTTPVAGGVGDTEPPDEEGSASENAAYTITSYNNADASGYWAQEVRDKLEITGTAQYPFTDSSIQFVPGEKDLSYYQPALQPKNTDEALFMISAPFGPEQSQISMPIKDNTVPIAAELATFDDEGNSVLVPVAVIVDAKTNTYYAQRDLVAKDAGHGGELVYWLGPSDSTVRARQYLSFPDGVHAPRVMEATKEALGLPTDASDPAIYSAIKNGKTYSYTPFADADTHPITTGYNSSPYADNTAALSAHGTAMASLPSEVCNTATAVGLMATGGIVDDRVANMVTGYYNDGDNFLEKGEAHAWIANSAGTITDPTPYAKAELKPEEGSSIEQVGTSALGLLTLAGLGTWGYRRRATIRGRVQDYIDQRALRSPRTQRAVTALQYGLYSNEGPRHFTQSTSDAWITTLETTPLTERLGMLPPDLTNTTANEVLQDKGISLSRGIRRALKRTIGLQQRTAFKDTQLSGQ